MIVGIGVDITKVSRFEQWASKPRKQLERVLTPAEIDYCLASPANSAQRFAARWAAKEAYFKALRGSGKPMPPFLQVCRSLGVNGPLVVSDFAEQNSIEPCGPQVHVSISHEQDYAIAFVLLYNPPISPTL